MNRLREALASNSTLIKLSEPNSDFPSHGGTVLIGSEKISYEAATDRELLRCTRGVSSTSPAAHAVNVAITLVSTARFVYDQENRRLSNVIDPTDAQDAATKQYVDTSASLYTDSALASHVSATTPHVTPFPFKPLSETSRDALVVAAVAATGKITYGTPDVLTAATGTITVLSYADLIGTKATGTITILEYADPQVAGSAISVNSKVLTEGVEWTAAVSNDATATSLAGAITTATATTHCTASATGPVVTLTANKTGVAGNVALATSLTGDEVSLSGAVLTGGTNGDSVTVAGHALTEGVDFWALSNNDTTAESIKALVHALSEVNATRTNNVVTVTAATGGAAGNAIALVTSDAVNCAVSGATLSGGKAASTVVVNGNTFTCVTSGPGAGEFSSITELEVLTEAVTGLNSSEDGADVSLVAATAGVAGNSITLAKTGAGLTLSGATLTGGVNRVEPSEGYTVYNTTSHKINFYSGTAWEVVTSA